MKRSVAVALLTLLILVSTVSVILADAAQDQESKNYVSGITSGRAKSLIGVALGLSSIIIGWRTKVRSPNKGRILKSWAVAGVFLGLTAVVLSVFHLSANAGGFGTGGGKAGAIVSLVAGILGATLSILALRSKNVPSGD